MSAGAFFSPGSSTLACSGCGASPPPRDPFPFRCPNAGRGDVDHVLVRHLAAAGLEFPTARLLTEETFVASRTFLHSYHRARAGGMSDDDFVSLAEDLDRRVAAIEEKGFSATPLVRDDLVSRRLGFADDGGVYVKDETGNVSGSHKARHLFGILCHLEVAEMLHLADAKARRPLAIASCGNAALAAAVVAAAGGRRLRVFVPVEADEGIVARLGDLGADVVVCRRRPGETGDPTYRALIGALDEGALPFTCQGNLNGLAIEGGETLGYEIVAALDTAGTSIDHAVVQVGGGALCSSVLAAFDETAEMGALAGRPQVHTVQTRGGHPLERAYHRVRRLAESVGVEDAVREAAAHRSMYMWPWETEPKSVAGGILDDETYDWVAVVAGMLSTGGVPLVVDEERLVEANDLGREAGYRADATGTSGLAGLIELVARGLVGPSERALVLFTGIDRSLAR